MEPVRTVIVVRGQFEAIHAWPDCPHDDVDFLRHPHRHIFHVELKIKVSHDDRELEFIQVKRRLQSFLNWFGKNIGSTSCEMLAKQIGQHFSESLLVYMVSVFEDNESGAQIFYE